MIGTSVSHYRIVDKLGSGGMGEVYAAEDLHLARTVAIKFPLLTGDEPDSAGRFLAEARAASGLDHPNIARVYDYGEAPDGRPFLVMELVRGTTLSQTLRNGSLTAAASIGVVEKVLRALAEAHRRGLVHRDIKPGNVMLTESDDVKVLDFGLAKPILDAPSSGHSEAETRALDPTQTILGVVRGTPEYMSPEQARGLRLDARSDLFSTGLVLYECLTGRSPFSYGSRGDTLDAVLRADVSPPSAAKPGVPRALDAITMKALAREPAARYQRADEMLEDLATVTAAMTGTTSGRMWATATRFVAPVPRWLWVAGPVLAIAALTGWFVWRGRPHVPPPEATAWYERGALALRDGAYFRAGKALEQAVALDPGFSLAHARLAEARSELDDAQGANREMLAALPTQSGEVARGVAALYVDAIHRTLLRDFPGAIASYEALARQVPTAERAAVLVDIGRVREKNAEASKAVDAYREAIRTDPQSAAAHLRLAILLARQNQPEYAAEFTLAEQLHQALGNPEGQAEVLYRRGVSESARLRLPDARADLEKAVDLAHAIGSGYQEVAARLQLSFVTLKEDQLEKAVQSAETAIEQARRAGFNDLVAQGLIDLGSAQLVKGEYRQAEVNFQEALDSARRAGMLGTEARASVSLASVHQQQGATDRVVADVEPALSYFQQAGFRREEMLCLTLIARANRDEGKDAEALAAFERLISLAQSQNAESQVGLALQGAGSVLIRQGRLPEAFEYFQREYQSAGKTGNRQELGYAQLNRATVLSELGRHEEAANALKEARDLAGPDTANVLAVLVIDLQARIALSQGMFRDAAAAARQGIAAAVAGGPARAEMRCIAGLALAHTGAGQDGRRMCEEGRSELRSVKDKAALARADMLLAEILVATGAPREAQDLIREHLDAIDAAGNKEAGWRAWALAARAYRQGGDSRHAAEAVRNASMRLAELRSAWGAAIDRYLLRPDVRLLQKDLK